MKYQISLEHKGESIVVKQTNDAITQLWIGKIDCSELGVSNLHEFLNNKQLVCRIYEALLAEIRKTPKTYFKTLEFNELVHALRLITSADRFARWLRALNCGGGHAAKTEEKTAEEVHKTVKEAIGDIYNTRNKFSKPEQWVLNLVSEQYVGNTIDHYEFENAFQPVKDDDSGVHALLKEFKAYPYTKFITKQDAAKIIESVTQSHAQVCESIAVFRKMRAIAGDDLVNWGPHKWASQVKKHAVKDSGYAAYHWLLTTVKDHLIKKGVKPAEKKVTAAQKLKSQAENGDSLSQEDLIKLFKNSNESDACGYIAQMTPATAASLLAIETKNVQGKLLDRGRWVTKPLEAIVENVASGTNPTEFRAVLNFLTSKDLHGIAPWKLFLNHTGSFKISEFIAFADKSRAPLPEGQSFISREFFDAVVSQIPMTQRYTLNAYISDAFLRYFANDAEKSRVLKDGNGDQIINWSLATDHFKSLPYSEIRSFILPEVNGEVRLLEQWEDFQDLIIANNDTEAAMLALIRGNSYNGKPYEFFKLLNFDQKIEVLAANKSSFELKNVFAANELKDFGRIALNNSGLASYVADLPTSYLNENLTVAHVTARMSECDLVFPLTDKTVKALSKENAKRVISHAQWEIESSLVDNEIELIAKLYSKLNRNELIEALQVQSLSDCHEFSTLSACIDHMTQDEIDESCKKSPKFLRRFVDKASPAYLSRYTEKHVFKEIVGDRRDRANDTFGRELEKRLAALK